MREKQIEKIAECINSYIHKKENRTMFIITDFETSVHRIGLAEHLYKEDYRKEIHGKWIKRENKSPTQSEAYCSICGRDAVYQVIDNRWQFEDYCPHCGSKNVR